MNANIARREGTQRNYVLGVEGIGKEPNYKRNWKGSNSKPPWDQIKMDFGLSNRKEALGETMIVVRNLGKAAKLGAGSAS